MYVFTSSKPNSSNIFRRGSILTILCPPKLIPRNKATKVDLSAVRGVFVIRKQLMVGGAVQPRIKQFLFAYYATFAVKSSEGIHRRECKCLSALDPRPVQRHRNLFHDLDSESLQTGHLARMIGEQPDAPQIQVRQDLRADSDFALGLALALGERRQKLLPMKRERCPLRQLLHRKAFRSLMQIDQRAPAFPGNPLHRALDGGTAIAARGSENIAH